MKSTSSGEPSCALSTTVTRLGAVLAPSAPCITCHDMPFRRGHCSWVGRAGGARRIRIADRSTLWTAWTHPRFFLHRSCPCLINVPCPRQHDCSHFHVRRSIVWWSTRPPKRLLGNIQYAWPAVKIHVKFHLLSIATRSRVSSSLPCPPSLLAVFVLPQASGNPAACTKQPPSVSSPFRFSKLDSRQLTLHDCV